MMKNSKIKSEWDWQTDMLSNNNKKKNDHRTPFELDRTRIIHTFPFRRLQGKFQMISGTESDFNRNRLTHSLEVASLAKNIYLHLKNKHRKSNKYTEIFRLEIQS